MKLEIIVPIISEDAQEMEQMCEDMNEYLRKYLLPGTELRFSHLQRGFPFIETELQGMINGAVATVDVYRKISPDIDGVFMDCFDDPGVYACREIGRLPVIGPYQAAILSAANLSDRIGIITTDEAGILNEEKKAREIGMTDHIASIRALDVSVENILEEKEKIAAAMVDLCVQMVKEDRVGAICLGCTGMFYVYDALKRGLREKKTDVVILEPLLNGIITLETMVRLGYTNHVPAEIDFDRLHWYQDPTTAATWRKKT